MRKPEAHGQLRDRDGSFNATVGYGPTRLHKGKSPVREMHTCMDKHENNPLPTRLHKGKSPVREMHTCTDTHENNPCLPDCTRANHRSGRCTHARTHTRTTPAYQTAQGQIAGQGDAHMHGQTREQPPAHQTAQGQITGQGDAHMHGHTREQPLPTRLHKGKSPVREMHTCTDTHENNPCLPDCTRANRRSERHTCTDTYENNPCLPDRTRANRWSGETYICTDTHNNNPCLPDCTRANRQSGRYNRAAYQGPQKWWHLSGNVWWTLAYYASWYSQLQTRWLQNGKLYQDRDISWRKSIFSLVHHYKFCATKPGEDAVGIGGQLHTSRAPITLVWFWDQEPPKYLGPRTPQNIANYSFPGHEFMLSMTNKL